MIVHETQNGRIYQRENWKEFFRVEVAVKEPSRNYWEPILPLPSKYWIEVETNYMRHSLVFWKFPWSFVRFSMIWIRNLWRSVAVCCLKKGWLDYDSGQDSVWVWPKYLKIFKK